MAKKIKSDLENVLNLKAVSIYKKIAGIIWCIGVLIILEFVLNDEPFAIESRMFFDYYIWTIPFFMLFQDRGFAYKSFGDRKWVWIIPYIINTVFLAMHLFARSNVLQTDFGFPPLVRECCCMFFWIMSIPLTIINSDKMWTLYAVFVYVNSIIYYWILMNIAEGLSDTLGYTIVNVVIIIMTYIISMSIMYYNFKQIFKISHTESD